MSGLTTGSAPFIESAQRDSQLFIEQPYELYLPENHLAWKQLYARQQDRWGKYANSRFLEGLIALQLDPNAIPRLEDVNKFLSPRTGFQALAVSGYVPAFSFFDCLRQKLFPTTITIRNADRLDYLPEPDIFHDIAGHVPMHTDPAFAAALTRFGDCARVAAELVASISGEVEQLNTLNSMVRAMARFFWFTVEFGLMREPDGIKVYGSGLLSSYGEIEHSVGSTAVQRFPFQLEWVVNQSFEIHRYQPLLFVVEDFEHLYELVSTLEEWMRLGKLDSVAAGEPLVNDVDLRSFLHGDG